MVDVDVVELTVTCAAAAIIMAALGILLFYFCTTRTQRQRYRKRCMNSRQSVEHVQSQIKEYQTARAQELQSRAPTSNIEETSSRD